MADASQLQLSPYALFDPSQWQNPYSNFQNQALPAASYAGWPTNAMGQPIQPQPGMTINQTPAQPAAAPAAAASPNAQWAFNNALLNAMGQPSQQQIAGGRGGTFMALSPNALNNIPNLRAQNNAMYGVGPGPGGSVATPASAGAQMATSPAASPAANAAGLTPQQYMALRANPGPVPTYGATVPQSASSAQPGSGVLQQFLANWKPAQSGPGAGFQQGFASALKGMGYS